MNAEFFAFSILSVFAIGGAVFFLNSVRVMHMAISLAFTFFSLAGIYFLLQAEFLAVVQVLIYAGGISILMIFGIMLTKPEEGSPGRSFQYHQWISLATIISFFVIIMVIIYQSPIFTPAEKVSSPSVQQIGSILFKQYAIPFELASILLLVALIGAIVLARKEQK
ncbi:NADH-quinone oxidoreductase subunit J [Shimazuella sp. AN120528]|uniref:NADH-quinone oxidoreductase subunit J n=1 Tax=Shimazuella soli TaxID=1892854 RepID=UPI001F0F8DE1|nr:NADH-quinone oxidoreductase subunit J [Shimazuella soli]MCH5585252.1 NADH-quinone oxidoreductase subunit J [Shimazuella soli]